MDRTWVRLWVGPWLTGSTRFELSSAERAVWIDMIALAGDSRYGGVVASGQHEDGTFEGYPVDHLALRLCHDPLMFRGALRKFERHEKAVVTWGKDEQDQDTVVIELLKWSTYQSEYLRQKPYRDKKRKGEKVTDGDVTKVTGEGVLKVTEEVTELLSSPLVLSSDIPTPIHTEYSTDMQYAHAKDNHTSNSDTWSPAVALARLADHTQNEAHHLVARFIQARGLIRGVENEQQFRGLVNGELDAAQEIVIRGYDDAVIDAAMKQMNEDPFWSKKTGGWHLIHLPQVLQEVAAGNGGNGGKEHRETRKEWLARCDTGLDPEQYKRHLAWLATGKKAKEAGK